jgi:hypothetical protein
VGNVAGELEISVSRTDVFSSFKPLASYSTANFPGAQEVRREKVEVARLDVFLAQNPGNPTASRIYLKVDTQDFEK